MRRVTVLLAVLCWATFAAEDTAEYRDLVMALAKAEAHLKLNEEGAAVSELRRAASLIRRNGGKQNVEQRAKIFELLAKYDDEFTARRDAAKILTDRAQELGNTTAAENLRRTALHVVDAAPCSIPDDAFCGVTGHYYKVFVDRYTWHDAKRRCEEMGGYLACVNNRDENIDLNAHRHGLKVWLGGTDEGTEGQWRWLDGSPFNYTAWFDAQPNNKNGKAHYLSFYVHEDRSDPRWNDLAADSEHAEGYICEWDDVTPTKPQVKPEKWDHIDTTNATDHGDFLRIKKQYGIWTKETYSGDIEVRLVARTDSTNIWLYAHQRVHVILNWSCNPKELRLHVGNNKPEPVKQATTPLRPHTWYTITWRITRKLITLSVNDKIVLSARPEKGEWFYPFGGAVGVSGAVGSVVDVKSLKVQKLE